MAEGKWIPGLSPDTPLEEAAHKTLHPRLEAVQHWLEPARDYLNPDPEPVHQLRVSARRASVALELFTACLPSKVYRQSHRRLRKLRHAAGQARDWDVLLATLTQRHSSRQATTFLLGYAQGQRAAAQVELETAILALPEHGVHLWKKIKAALAPPTEKDVPTTLFPLARSVLTALIQELREADPANTQDVLQLHRIRIIGKRLRYSMEVFVDCFAPPFRERLYPLVEQMQEVLGTLNDSRMARQHLQALSERLRAVRPDDWKRHRPEITRWLRFHQRRLQRQRRLFQKWQEHWYRSGAEEELLSMLTLAHQISH